jgi:hypothetical protein
MLFKYVSRKTNLDNLNFKFNLGYSLKVEFLIRSLNNFS